MAVSRSLLLGGTLALAAVALIALVPWCGGKDRPGSVTGGVKDLARRQQPGPLTTRSNRMMPAKDLVAAGDSGGGPALSKLFSRELCLGGNDARCAEAQPLAARCDDGEAAGCTELIKLITRGPSAGLAVHRMVNRRACNKAGGEACARADTLDRWRRLDTDETARSEASTACDKGDGLACASLAVGLAGKDRPKALEAASHACDLGVFDLGGCGDVALYSDDPQVVEFALREACNSGAGDGCFLLGYFLSGECASACIAVSDPTGAKKAFERACDLSGHACEHPDL